MSLGLMLNYVFERNSKTRLFPYTGLLIATGLTFGMIFGATFGNRQIKIEHVKLEYSNLPENFDNYRIIQLSDLHLGGMFNPEKKLKKIKNQLDRLQPDLLLFTGDMVNNFAYESKKLEDIMAQITGIAESYSILGNHDYGDYTNWENTEKKQTNFNGILRSQELMGFTMLNNDHVILRRDEDSVVLAGVENWGHSPFPQYANLEKALAGVNPESFIILMTHDPAHWESQVSGKEDIEFTLAGHTHGLQWGIKLAGIPFSLAYLTRKNWGGLYQTGNSLLYVNTGFGTVGMPWRLDMPAEITLFTLKRSEVD
jgi:predicted MPP superfamily phosphohydrolase